MLVASIARASHQLFAGPCIPSKWVACWDSPISFSEDQITYSGSLFSRVSYIGNLWPKSSCLEPEEAENLPAHLIHVLPAPFPGYKDEHYSALAFQAVAMGRETLPGPMRSSI